MTLRVAIVADDLTGALDTGTPFVEAGLSVAVAVEVDAIAEALASGTAVVVVNTASRAVSPSEAEERVRQAGEALRSGAPRIVMKKIDSRLKGNVAAESRALAEVFGHSRIILAPAIPDQGRATVDGMVVGRGVDQPIFVASLFGANERSIEVADAANDDDLDAIAKGHDWGVTLAVGARGLGLALARLVGKPARRPDFFATPKTLFALGSRDPITIAQTESLITSNLLGDVMDAEHGVLHATRSLRLPALLRCIGEMTSDSEVVARHFARGVKVIVEESRPDMLVVGGGDTALAVFREMGMRVLLPRGEIEPGVPWFKVTTDDGRTLRCAVKSGGFGQPDSLLRVIERNQAA
ncbi:uncharacterized protein YgbK (DUF1537 family) [Pararhizobium capsulatum DSM 1112]|uniref:Uncharacterized protein YgbK (DUF1537 family) n=1 Tax=Pararhizobium capsulatum DSM 1112 TaxID=1121113 RepID=A0ABU0BWK2_9HYPH|nr:four-carbon acid sugar kinase family protein [Pararhizobium capsulatum]MDQ0322632.1 uncharacterized protein YgbK (DUF1537 family) [Pararhizobium capsulatum DSM 1112]